MKCSCCGEEVGSASVCPICGSSVVAKSSPTVSFGTPNTPSKGSNHGDLTATHSATRWGEYYSSMFAGRNKEGNENVAPVQNTATDDQNILQRIAQEKTELVEKCAKSVSKVIVDCGKTLCTGTGWCGYENYIITNAHVVEAMVEGRGKKIVCEFSDKLNLGKNQTIAVKMVYYSEVEDIAILLPESGKLPYGVQVLRIEDRPTKQGELVFTIGNPLHYKFTYTEGSVANPNYKQAGSKRKFTVLQTTLTLNHGNSGGPVFNTNGDIVGMATFGELHREATPVLNPEALINGDMSDLIIEERKEILGYGFCVKSEAILAAIKEIKR